MIEAQSWMESGDHIVLGIDCNEDVCSGDIAKQLEQIGLQEAITKKHRNNGPRTYDRGSKPIDGLFVSEALHNNRCGYIHTFSDHAVLWIYIPMVTALGHKLLPIV